MTETIAVTGGTGFVGAALIDHLLKDGFSVRALARDPARLQRASDVEVTAGSLENASALQQLATGANTFIHCAGLTHAKRDQEFFSVNVDGAAAAASAAAAAGARFIHMSSMSARKPEASAYARSKFESEDAVKTASAGNPWLALRAPAIYGPRDMVTLPYFKMVRAGFAAEPRTSPDARASILHVDDVASAAITAMREAPDGVVYEIGDERPGGHEWREIGEILGDVLGGRPRRIRVPRLAINLFHGVSRSISTIRGRTPSVRSGQINEFFHPDWAAKENLLTEATSWRPQISLKEGFAKTVHWYQESGLL